MRDNMPFGDVGKGEFGTYFIGYAKSPHRIEQMLSNMFVGKPPGNYDRLLDFSRAVTGYAVFRAVSDVSGECSDRGRSHRPPMRLRASTRCDADSKPRMPAPDGSLGIGSLKGETGHE